MMNSEEIQIVINIPKKLYNRMRNYHGLDDTYMAVKRGTPLPKGHGDLFDKAEILRFLKCPKYETCDWKNCFDCNESRCINLNNVNELIPIIKADKEESEEV